MSKTTPLISVLMPAYNRQNFISDSIKSILEQTYANFELIIVDDASTDNTVQQILNFKDNRIKLLQNERNLGIAFTRNRLFKEAKGMYFAILDSDDIALPNRLQEQVDFLQLNPDILLTGSAIIGINESGNKINNKGAVIKSLTDSTAINATLLFRNSFIQSSIMINAALLGDMAYNTDYPLVEDYEFWSRLSMHYKLCNLATPLVMYRFHPTNISHSTKESVSFDLINKIALDKFKFHFDYTPTPDEFYIHNLWQFGSYKTTYQFLKDSNTWLKKVRALNRSKKEFDDTVFIKVIRANWFQRCWYFGEKGNLLTCFYYLFYNSNFKIADVPTFFHLAAKGAINFLKRK